MALWWLLPAGVAPVGLVGVPFACEVGRFACGATKLGGSCREEAAARKLPRGSCREEAAARKLPRGARGMDALTTERYAGKRPARHFKRCKGLKPVKRQP